MEVSASFGLSIFCSLGGVFLSFYGMKDCAITTDVWIVFFLCCSVCEYNFVSPSVAGYKLSFHLIL